MRTALIEVEKLEEGSRIELITSPDLERCNDLPAAITPSGQIVSRWTFTPAERAAIAGGADIYLFVWNGGRALQPVGLCVVDEVLGQIDGG